MSTTNSAQKGASVNDREYYVHLTDGGVVIPEEPDEKVDDNVCAPCYRCGSYEQVDAISADNHMVCSECSR